MLKLNISEHNKILGELPSNSLVATCLRISWPVWWQDKGQLTVIRTPRRL